MGNFTGTAAITPDTEFRLEGRGRFEKLEAIYFAGECTGGVGRFGGVLNREAAPGVSLGVGVRGQVRGLRPDPKLHSQ